MALGDRDRSGTHPALQDSYRRELRAATLALSGVPWKAESLATFRRELRAATLALSGVPWKAESLATIQSLESSCIAIVKVFTTVT